MSNNLIKVHSIRFKIGLAMLLSLGILIAAYVFIQQYSFESYEKGFMQDELNSIANSFYVTISQDGDFSYSSKDKILKSGKNTINSDNSLIENFKEGTKSSICIFWENEPCLFYDGFDNSKIYDKTWKSVMGGESLFLVDENNNYSLYVPLKQPSTSEIVGMIYARKSLDDAGEVFEKTKSKQLVSIVVIFFVVLVETFCFLKIIFSSFRRVTGQIDKMVDSDLELEFEERDLRRNDEIGDLARAAFDLANNIKDAYMKLYQSSGISIKDREKLGYQVQHIESSADNILFNEGHISKELDKISDKNKDATLFVQQISVVNSRDKDYIEEIERYLQAIFAITEETRLVSLGAIVEATKLGDDSKGYVDIVDRLQVLSKQAEDNAYAIDDLLKSMKNLNEDNTDRIKDLDSLRESEEGHIFNTSEYLNNIRLEALKLNRVLAEYKKVEKS
ncbi:Methyl-accepting chemotaxis protein [Acetitomaculum ruminis DSM 5522]|uniref:Methyl-accepting chemotaxis protein n=1 Tax=Acetitomaculum ruminis DSM 5522 TaxID=1120918 RepID=A0A1I0YSB7_9FIRM|nr:hypothetical protein [Acetitomaculum ruminis]SFB16279.1 Methyl-accepting chemotaxis protein [Acetitomaculum ruminis DSM 5522]